MSATMVTSLYYLLLSCSFQCDAKSESCCHKTNRLACSKNIYRICMQIVGHSVHTLVLVPNPSMKCLVPGTSHALLVA